LPEYSVGVALRENSLPTLFCPEKTAAPPKTGAQRQVGCGKNRFRRFFLCRRRPA
jgi:hypothetical protein